MIRQLSVFIENVPGSLMQVTKCLKDAGINLMAISSFGIRDPEDDCRSAGRG